MIDLARQEALALLGFLAFGDVDGGADHAHAFAVGVEDRLALGGDPADHAVFLADSAVFDIVQRRA